jgi:hypothetical protein
MLLFYPHHIVSLNTSASGDELEMTLRCAWTCLCFSLVVKAFETSFYPLLSKHLRGWMGMYKLSFRQCVNLGLKRSLFYAHSFSTALSQSVWKMVGLHRWHMRHALWWNLLCTFVSSLQPKRNFKTHSIRD